MIELMYDVTPSADFAFHTAFEGPADFASGITDLVNAGADVIVDDVFYKSQPFFQDSVIAQAADQAADAGVPYFSSAGNANRQSHETDFRDSGQTFDLFGGDDKDDSLAHDFDPGSGTDILQEFSLANNESIGLSFQWDQPHAQAGGTGSANDMDIFVVNDNGQIVTGSADTNVNGDPVEFLNFTNTTGSAANFNLLITQYLPAGGPTPGKIKYIDFSGGTSDAEFFTNSSTSFGHPNAAGAAGVGAAFYGDTPECGTNPPQVEDFSSAGGTEILFDTDGNRLNSPEVRDQPRFTAPDGTNTTFFGSDIAQDSDSSPNFFGTSAAAPHAAAVAALMQEAAGGPNSLTPEEIYTALENTAIDMGDSGFDFNTGNGLIQAPEAIEAVADQGNESPTAVNNTASTEEDTATTINVLSNDDFGGDGPASNSLVIASAASNGNAAVDNSGTPNDPTDDRIDYTPKPNFNGSDSFDYRIEDSNGDTSTATVTVSVNSNNAPTANNDTFNTDEDATATGNVLANDIDPDGDLLNVTAVNGNLGDVGDQITLSSGAELTLSSDGNGGTDTATVNFIINLDLRGTPQPDTLIGGPGNDDITGLGAGDTMTGNAGEDRFVYENLNNLRSFSGFEDAFRDTITDFEPGSDVIDFSQAIENSFFPPFNSNTPFQDYIKLIASNSDTKLKFDLNGDFLDNFKEIATLKNVSPGDLSANDFEFATT